MVEPDEPWSATASAFRYGMVALMLAAIALPGLLGLLATQGPRWIRGMLAQGPLIGEQGLSPFPPATLDTIGSAKLQDALAARFERGLYPRSLIVRLANQAYYDLFSKSYVYDRQILIGRHRFLYEKAYIGAYCRGTAIGPAALSPLVSKLQTLHQRLAAIGRLLIFVVTPSKAVTVPEFLPAGACPAPPNPGAGAAALIGQLRAAGVPVIDGPGLVRAMKRDDPLPPFPRGGTHWSNLASSRIAQAMLGEVDRLAGEDLGGFTLSPPRWDAAPEGSDGDLATILNLYWPPLGYRTGRSEVQCRPTPAGRQTLLVAVGGSFAGGPLLPMAQCKLFRDIDYYFYYAQLRRAVGNSVTPIDRKSVDWKAIFREPSVLLVELNEVYLTGGQPFPWLDPFLDDALSALQ